ncbi:M20/M25/M40 family metallo-hydrolase [Agromyces aerolatus]|uniref:M20/M25/M40 family metallo-hydrolase n=1 Tax=Agromyces sp. LY-1074 TaxID=3074080 RepID=UPI0028606571|nr:MULTISPECIES: M20/M25/M40 family metallo-hydrolase [unclassified Agromyces]MDR5699795.1 M20/M25/M40 family metallo-hydrolase [Agromyces sp. LY-1074]MDR5706091.1 M20/M25/M40 family metallo-hydrolase [Agromyces sp. LY-1358]
MSGHEGEAHESDVPVRAGAAERLSRMVQLPTVSAELETRGLDDFERFRELIDELYPLVAARLELERVGDLGLLYHWRGGGAGDPVVLMAHFDVVPAASRDGWRIPPFEGRIEDGRVWGRGALDDKGPLLVVLEAVENLLAVDFIPARDVYLSFGGDEESYGRAARAISDLFQERGITPWLVIDEGGAVVDAPLPFVKVPTAMVGVGEKGVLTVRLRAVSDGGHASAPPKLTATARVGRAVARLTPSTFPARTPASTRAMLAAFTPHTRGGARALLRLLTAWPWLTARVFARLGGEPAALVRTTVAPTMLEGGSAHNVLPSEASAIVNLRIAIGETIATTVKRLRRAVGDPHVAVEIVEGSEPSAESPVDDARFAHIADAVAAAYPEAITAPYLMMAATDSRWFHRFSPAVYRFAPLAMTAAQRATIHGVDEHVTIDSLERGERFHRALLTALPR